MENVGDSSLCPPKILPGVGVLGQISWHPRTQCKGARGGEDVQAGDKGLQTSKLLAGILGPITWNFCIL